SRESRLAEVTDRERTTLFERIQPYNRWGLQAYYDFSGSRAFLRDPECSYPMAFAEDLLAQASLLVHQERKHPSHAGLRRAGSTAYYALFHHLRTGAALILGTSWREHSNTKL